MNTKTLAKYGLFFVNTGSLFRLRASLPTTRNRPFFVFDGRSYSYRETYLQALRYAWLFLSLKEKHVCEGHLEPDEALRIGIYQQNNPAFVFAFFGAALSGSVLFGINTGFRGNTLATVIDQAQMRLLITQPSFLDELTPILGQLAHIGPDQVLLSEPPERQQQAPAFACLQEAVDRHADTLGRLAEQPPRVRIRPFDPLVVIYTSGTTGAPKGVACSQLKLVGTALLGAHRLGLKRDDRGYLCMPLFHSNAWFLGVMPLLAAGGSFLLKPRFSASAFEDDILEHGVSFMNYVGQPIHYILSALEKKHGSAQAVTRALSRHPRNRFRIAHGNGAPAADRLKLMRYLGMEHVYELYGATEAAIHTCNMPGDPPATVGEVEDSVLILDESGQPCPYGRVDENGKLCNYDQAVGEICREIDADNVFFDGYFNNESATDNKYRDGFFRSGDLGHLRLEQGKRFLYFNGRTDDWIRKDGENFSAESVAEHVLAHPDVAIAAAYGAPCAVSDEHVMVAIQLREGAIFDPKNLFDFLLNRQQQSGMDPKWMPDYLRIDEALPMTHTQKVIVRHLKRQHFHLEKHPELQLYRRTRGDESFHPLGPEDFATLRQSFVETGREELLDP